jgi:hypothetical protein
MIRKMRYFLRIKSRIKLEESFLNLSRDSLVFPISPLKRLLCILLVDRNRMKYLQKTFLYHEIFTAKGLSTVGSLSYLTSIRNIRLHLSSVQKMRRGDPSSSLECCGIGALFIGRVS